uniref:Protein kinase domain-containing protein n=1 Tax=Trypanosoma congolense (strain IL3000) TaxID=1068625 RepID=G0UZC5_TRYCI|nr:conserved hypothetical protein [Trypanosoma congolense IL3000]
MSSAKLLLSHVIDVTPTSILFSAEDNGVIDFQTVSTIPKAHRDCVQKNGFVAKVMLSVTSKARNWGTHEDRLMIWWGALLSSGLIRPNVNTVTAPANLSEVLWPIIDDETLMMYVDTALKRQENKKLNECPYVVPILRAEKIFYKHKDTKGTLCVIWMPRYSYNLAQWSKLQLTTRFVPEAVLFKLLCSIINGLIILGDLCVECPTSLSMEDILLGGANEKEPVFLLNISIGKTMKSRFGGSSIGSSTLLFAPELLMQPCKLLSNTACHMWSIGMMVYQIASGLPREESKARVVGARSLQYSSDDMILNNNRLKPTDIVMRVRSALQAGSYSNLFIHVVLLMIGQDPHTRPTPRAMCDILRDLLRFKPVVRFPFAIGPFTLVHLWSESRIAVDPVKQRYDTDTMCVVCHSTRSNLRCVESEHTSALCSPLWSAEEPLPGYAVACRTSMTYLYPMLGRLDKKEQRRLIDAALHGGRVNKNGLLQLLGGFALLKENEGKSVVAHDVLVPFPHGVLQKEDKHAVATDLHFTAALPWPSQCTFHLQQEGRIQRSVPGLFGFSTAHWYAWILPGEKLEVNGELWIPAPDGAFVFWFNENLQPSEFDRYFVLCSVLSLTWQAKVKCSVLPDHAFKRKDHVDSATLNNVSEEGYSSALTSSQGEPSLEPRRRRDGKVLNKNERRALESRSVNSMINLPKVGEGPKARGEGILPAKRQASSNTNTMTSTSNSCEMDNTATSARRSIRRGSTMIRMDYVDDLVTGMVREDGSEIDPQGQFQPQPPQQQQHNVSRQQSHSTGGIISVLHESGESTEPAATRHTTHSARESRHTNPHHPEGLPYSCPEPPADSPRGRPRHSGERRYVRMSKEDSKEPSPSCKPTTTSDSSHNQVPSVARVDRTLSPKESAIMLQSKTGVPLNKPPLRVFGRWYPAQQVDAAFQSLTFCVLSTGEHGTLSPPVKLSLGVRAALHAPDSAVYTAFAANIVPLIRRNHPKSPAGLSHMLSDTRSIIPHHALVFYDVEEQTVGLLALRFALTSSPDITAGEMLLPVKFLPQVEATPAFNAQLNAAYFTGNAIFKSSTTGHGELLRHSMSLQRPGSEELQSTLSKKLTFSPARFVVNEDSQPKQTCGDDDALPFCWVGFETESRMLMIADVDRLSWYPLYFSEE